MLPEPILGACDSIDAMYAVRGLRVQDYYASVKLHGIQVKVSVIAVNNITLNSAPSNRLMRLSLATSSGFREGLFGDQANNNDVTGLKSASIIDYSSMCWLPNVKHRDMEFDNMVNGSAMQARVMPSSAVVNPEMSTGALSPTSLTAYYDSNRESSQVYPSNSSVPNKYNS